VLPAFSLLYARVLTSAVQVRQGIEAQLRNPLHKYHSRVRLINYNSCYFFNPITLEELDKVRP
jgi:hypothetical protein